MIDVFLTAHRAAIHSLELTQLDAKLHGNAPEDIVAEIAAGPRESSCGNPLFIDEESNGIVLATRDFLEGEFAQ